jgi:hypothetical protein
MDALHAGLLLFVTVFPAANYQTTNFVVTAPTAEFAAQVGEAAEVYRRELAITWLARELPPWSQRCPIFVKVGDYGAGGATSFSFDQGEVFGWKMNVQGTDERILDSVLPHEINHTIFASYFRRPLPRWADEGAASLIEHESERMRLKKIHEQVMQTTRKIPLRKLLPMRDYPADTQQVLTLYAEGYSLADFLIQQSSKREYLRFISTALSSGWNTALKASYGYQSVDDLERDLDQWIVAGSPDLASREGEFLALSNRPPRTTPPTIRAQSDELLVTLGAPAAWPKRAAKSPATRNDSLAAADPVPASRTAPRSPQRLATTAPTASARPLLFDASELPTSRRLSRGGLTLPTLVVRADTSP